MPDTQTWQNIASVPDIRELADVGSKVSIALQSQYSHGARFQRFGRVMQEQIDATEQVDEVYSDVANINTAGGVFLDWWGQRVGVDRFIKVNGEYQRFDDDYFRFLLKYRAVCNLADSTAATMNRNLSSLTNTRVFVVGYQDMAISSIVFIGAIDPIQAQVLANYGLLNRPAGVLANYLIIYPDERIFGFNGSNLQPFNQGVFNPGQSIPVS